MIQREIVFVNPNLQAENALITKVSTDVQESLNTLLVKYYNDLFDRHSSGQGWSQTFFVYNLARLPSKSWKFRYELIYLGKVGYWYGE